GILRRRAVEELDAAPIAGERGVQLAHDLLELGTRVLHPFACEGGGQRCWHLARCAALANVLDGRARPGGTDWQGRRLRAGPGRVGAACRRGEEGILALDVEVERAVGDAEGVGDVRHLRAPVAARDEDLGGAVDELREAIVGDGPWHRRGPYN